MLTTYETSGTAIHLTMQSTWWTKLRSVIVALLLSINFGSSHLGFRSIRSPLVWAGLVSMVAMFSSRVWSLSDGEYSRQVRLFKVLPLRCKRLVISSTSFIDGRIGYLNLNRATLRKTTRPAYSLPLRVGTHPNGFSSIKDAHDVLVGYGVLSEVEAAATYQPPDAETLTKNRRKERRVNATIFVVGTVAAVGFAIQQLIPVFEGKRSLCVEVMGIYTQCT